MDKNINVEVSKEKVMDAKGMIKILISIFLISELFFLMVILAFNSDDRTVGLFKTPLPFILIMTDMACILFVIYHGMGKRIVIDKYNLFIAIITLVSCNFVLGYCTFMYLNSFRLDDLLFIFMSGFLMKYIFSHVATLVDNIRLIKN